jgi:hypothetical protein
MEREAAVMDALCEAVRWLGACPSVSSPLSLAHSNCTSNDLCAAYTVHW